MLKNTDLHLKIRTVTAQKRFGEPGAKKKGFARTKELTFLVRYFWVL
jgi:hypothetical protein